MYATTDESRGAILESPSVKIFDLAHAPDEVREGGDFMVLLPTPDDPDTILLGVVVGRYFARVDSAGNEIATREITYGEYRLHLWLLESGAEPGESVLLRWSGAPL